MLNSAAKGGESALLTYAGSAEEDNYDYQESARHPEEEMKDGEGQKQSGGVKLMSQTMQKKAMFGKKSTLEETEVDHSSKLSTACTIED